MVPAPALPAIAGDTLWCLGLGLLLAMARSALGWGLGNGRILAFVWDLLAFAAAAVALRGFAAGVSASGVVRWYMVVGVAAGACAWQGAVAPALQAAGKAVLALALRPWRWFCRHVSAPAAEKARNWMKSKIALHREKQKIREKKAKTKKKQLQNPANMLYN